MEVRLGVVHSHKELRVEVAESVQEIASRVESALSNSSSVLWLEDEKGQRVGVPVDKLAYVEIVGEEGKGPVGFGPE